MSRISPRAGRPARFAGATKYDAHHNVLSKTYGALADLRRELSDSKTRVAEREELLKIFAACTDSQRAWLLLEDYFEKQLNNPVYRESRDKSLSCDGNCALIFSAKFWIMFSLVG